MSEQDPWAEPAGEPQPASGQGGYGEQGPPAGGQPGYGQPTQPGQPGPYGQPGQPGPYGQPGQYGGPTPPAPPAPPGGPAQPGQYGAPEQPPAFGAPADPAPTAAWNPAPTAAWPTVGPPGGAYPPPAGGPPPFGGPPKKGRPTALIVAAVVLVLAAIGGGLAAAHPWSKKSNSASTATTAPTSASSDTSSDTTATSTPDTSNTSVPDTSGSGGGRVSFSSPDGKFTAQFQGTPQFKRSSENSPAGKVPYDSAEYTDGSGTDEAVGVLFIPSGASYNLHTGLQGCASGVGGSLSGEQTGTFSGYPSDTGVVSVSGNYIECEVVKSPKEVYVIAAAGSANPPSDFADFAPTVQLTP